MSLLKHLRRIEFINYLISKKATGDLQTFATKNRLSKRGLLNVLQDMKEYGFDIKYDRVRQTYYYGNKEQKKLFLNLANMPDTWVLTREELREISVHGTMDYTDICFSPTQTFEKC